MKKPYQIIGALICVALGMYIGYRIDHAARARETRLAAIEQQLARLSDGPRTVPVRAIASGPSGPSFDYAGSITNIADAYNDLLARVVTLETNVQDIASQANTSFEHVRGAVTLSLQSITNLDARIKNHSQSLSNIAVYLDHHPAPIARTGQ